MKRLGILLFCATAMSAGAALPALAQSAQPARPDTDTDTGAGAAGAAAGAAQRGGSLDEIIVTAQKRAQLLEDVPISIMSVGEEVLASAGVDASAQLPQLVPGLRMDFSGGFAQPTIRGVGAATAGNGLQPNVATYIDGFYMPSALANNFQLASVTDVSVLKGPQGTLFGRNATGGAIVVTTADPSFAPEGKVSASFERYNRLVLNGYLSTGLTDKLAVNVAAMYDRGNGFITNLVNKDNKWGQFDSYVVRGKLLYQASDDVRFIAAYSHQQQHDPNVLSQSVVAGPGGVPLSTGALIPGGYAATERGTVSENYQSDYRVKADTATLTAEFDLGFATLASRSMYRKEKSNSRADYDHSNIPIFDYSFNFQDETFTQEFDLASSAGGGRFEWVLGAFYIHDKDLNTAFDISLGGAPFVLGYTGGQKTDALAVFADGTYEVSDGLFLTAGVRYSTEKRRAWFDVHNIAAGPLGSGQNQHRFNSVTPRAVVRYELAPRTSVYASWSRGFKSGAFNPSGQDVSTYVDPETIDAFEVGFKTASSTLRLNASAFYYDYRDLQLASYESSSSHLQNAANSRIYGADVDAVYSPLAGLQLRAAAAYTHATFKSYPVALRYVQCLDPVACGAGFGTFVPTPQDSSDLSMPRAPRFTASLGVQYAIPLAAGGLTLNADLYHTSRIWFDAVEQFGQKAYDLVNLRATYALPGDHVQLSVFGTNVFDTSYRSQVLPAALSIAQTYGNPASYGAAVTVKF